MAGDLNFDPLSEYHTNTNDCNIHLVAEEAIKSIWVHWKDLVIDPQMVNSLTCKNNI